MYGKQFVAALLFLAVAQVNAQEYGDYGDYGNEAPADYEATPEPDVVFDDAAAELTIPDGDWKVSYGAFEIFQLADDDAIFDWAAGLDESIAADYEPTGYVLVGTLDVVADETDVVAIGLQKSSDDIGLAAVYRDGSFSSYAFEFATAGVDGVLDYEPEFLSGTDMSKQDGLVENAGIMVAFGQSLSSSWNIWNYEVSSSDHNLDDSTFDVLFVQYDSMTDQWSSFTDSLDIVLSGASSLMATAATASVLLAFM